MLTTEWFFQSETNLYTMKPLRTTLCIASVLFILSGIIFFFFLIALNDPEIEGDSGRVSLSTYFISLIPIAIGTFLFLIFSKLNKK